MADPHAYCEALRAWARVMREREREQGDSREFSHAVGLLEAAIGKSCLLDRLIYGGEAGPSQTPCPVHKGEWQGIHGPWPGSVWVALDGTRTPTTPAPQCQEWYDQGCRCFMHKCGCTTGWQPDEHCGCGPKE